MARNKLSALVVTKMVDRMTAPARKIQKSMRSLRKTMQMRGVDERWRRVGDQVTRFKRNARGLARMSGWIGASTAALGYMFTRLASGNDRIAKFARQINWTTDQLQEMRYAAQILAGVNNQAFDTSMQRFTRRVAEAAAGTGEAQAALEHLGVELTDGQGKIRNTADLLEDVADAIQNVKNEQTRNLISTKLFDMEGVALVNMLSAGREEIKKFRAEAHTVGSVVDPETLKRSEEYGDNVTRLGAVLSGIAKRVQAVALPAVVKITNTLVRMVTDIDFNKNLKDGIDGFMTVLRALRDVIAWVVELVGGWKNAMIGLFSLLSAGVILSFLGMVKSLGVALWGLATLVIPSVVAALKWLAVAAAVNPFLLVIAGIAAAAALIIANWEPIKSFFAGLWADIKDIFDKALGWISPIGDRLAAMIPDFIKNRFSGTEVSVKAVPETLTDRRAQNGAASAEAAPGARQSNRLIADNAPLPETLTQRRTRTTYAASENVARAEVAGEVHIRIDSEGRPRVRSLRQSGDVGLRVDTGFAFAGS